MVEAVQHGSGHINETYAATYDQAGARVRYVHQRINGHVFREPLLLMDNVSRWASVLTLDSESGPFLP